MPPRPALREWVCDDHHATLSPHELTACPHMNHGRPCRAEVRLVGRRTTTTPTEGARP